MQLHLYLQLTVLTVLVCSCRYSCNRKYLRSVLLSAYSSSTQTTLISSNCCDCPLGYYGDVSGNCYKFADDNVLLNETDADNFCADDIPSYYTSLPMFQSSEEYWNFVSLA